MNINEKQAELIVAAIDFKDDHGKATDADCILAGEIFKAFPSIDSPIRAYIEHVTSDDIDLDGN